MLVVDIIRERERRREREGAKAGGEKVRVSTCIGRRGGTCFGERGGERRESEVELDELERLSVGGRCGPSVPSAGHERTFLLQNSYMQAASL